MTDLKAGDKAPSFELPDQDGKIHKLSDYQGSKLVLFFYPKDNTPTCTVEACNLRDNYSELKKNGFKILGISADSERKHTNFIAKHDLPYPLLADTEKKMVLDYGVYGPKKMFGKLKDGIFRTTFIINEEGIISDVITKVKAKEHANQILEQKD